MGIGARTVGVAHGRVVGSPLRSTSPIMEPERAAGEMSAYRGCREPFHPCNYPSSDGGYLPPCGGRTRVVRQSTAMTRVLSVSPFSSTRA